MDEEKTNEVVEKEDPRDTSDMSNQELKDAISQTLEKIRTLYAKINGIIDLPIMKIEKIYNDKEFAKKYIASSSHSLPSQEFIDLYLECIKLDNRNIMLCNLKRLYGYSFGNLDFDPKCFCLRFQKKSPFRV